MDNYGPPHAYCRLNAHNAVSVIASFTNIIQF